MGIFLDTVEDNSEFQGRLIDARKLQFVKHPKTEYCCQYCGFKSFDYEEYAKHLYYNHRGDYCYFMVNGQIGRDKARLIIDKPVTSNKIYCFGDNENYNFEIKYKDSSDLTIKTTHCGKIENLSEALPENVVGEITLTALIDRHKEMCIYLLFPQNISFDEDKLIKEIDCMQSDLNNGIFSYVKFFDVPKNYNFNDYELNCWNGFYDYSIGINQLVKGEVGLAKSKLEKSYSYLSETLDLFFVNSSKINDTLANMIKTLLSILEIKMCYFNYIRKASSKSIFYPVRLLLDKNFRNSFTDWKLEESDNGIFFDNSTKIFIYSCVYILNASYDEANKKIKEFIEEPTNENSTNAKDLRDFLIGRLAEKSNNLELAKQHYGFLVDNNQFKNEYTHLMEKING